jgi:hypothetical protein
VIPPSAATLANTNGGPEDRHPTPRTTRHVVTPSPATPRASRARQCRRHPDDPEGAAGRPPPVRVPRRGNHQRPPCGRSGSSRAPASAHSRPRCPAPSRSQLRTRQPAGACPTGHSTVNWGPRRCEPHRAARNGWKAHRMPRTTPGAAPRLRQRASVLSRHSPPGASAPATRFARVTMNAARRSVLHARARRVCQSTSLQPTTSTPRSSPP